MSEIHALSGAYAIDAVDDLERAAFDRHLADCGECLADVASFRETAAVLAQAVAVEPPAALRGRLLGAIGTIRPEPPAAPAPAPAPAAPAASRDPRQPGQIHRLRRWLPGLAAAVVLAVVGIAVWQPWHDEQAPPPSATEQVLQADDAAQETLRFPGGASATLVRSDSQGQAVLVTEDMPAAPAGKVYQLWFDVPGEGMVSAGLMPPKADQTVLLEGDADAATGAGITVEPAGGSDAPTSDPIALFDFGALEPRA